jgi:PTH1 family peptidyl-tRNA hydrolase
MVVGLGNPGREYEQTRHNVGKRFLRYLWHSFSPDSQYSRPWGEYGVALWEGKRVFLATFSSFMNHSGEALKSALKELPVEPPSLFIAHDDLDLPFGVVRLKEGGSPAGHRGLLSIYEALGGDPRWKRIRFGIGRPLLRQRQEIIRYVLDPFSPEEEERLRSLFFLARNAFVLSLKEGFLRAQTWLHSQKEPFSREG